MPIVYNPTGVMVELRYSCLGQQVENILYFDMGATPTIEDLETLADEISSWWTTWVRPLQSAAVTLREIYCRSLVAAITIEHSLVLADDNTGTAIGAPSPNSVTLAISFRTQLTGRSSRGRNYVIGLTEIMVTDNDINADVVASWVEAYRDLIGNAGSITSGIWCVYSQYSSGEERATGLLIPISAVIVTDSVVDSQRRRLPGRGA